MQNCTFSYNNAGQLGGATAADGTDTHTEDCEYTGQHGLSTLSSIAGKLRTCLSLNASQTGLL